MTLSHCSENISNMLFLLMILILGICSKTSDIVIVFHILNQRSTHKGNYISLAHVIVRGVCLVDLCFFVAVIFSILRTSSQDTKYGVNNYSQRGFHVYFS